MARNPREAMAESPLAGTSVLLVEDEPLLLKRLAAALAAEGADVTAVGSLKEARAALAGLDFDAAVLDVNLPDGRGTDLLRERQVPAGVAVVVITAGGGVTDAVEAMRLGASDYVVKPFDAAELPVRIRRARRVAQAARVEEFRRDGAGGAAPEFLFGRSLAGVEEMLGKIIAADARRRTHLAPVLVEGETGTGKTTIARWLHRHGPRAAGPLVEVNCAALPEALAESELFGHERGAFTDARAARSGLLEAADGGTLFLDELPSLSPALQAKLLTVIEDHTVRRIGANKGRAVDVRLVAATNADLRELVAAGKFREDLLHRLDLFRVRLPPLRERGDDILRLAEALVARTARHYGLQPVPAIPAAGAARLRAHAWPGNVRELAHAVERALVFEGAAGLGFGSLVARAAPADPGGEGWLKPGFTFPATGFSLEGAVNELIRRALLQTGDNVSAAARLLGVSRDFVRYRLRNGGAEEENGN